MVAHDPGIALSLATILGVELSGEQDDAVLEPIPLVLDEEAVVTEYAPLGEYTRVGWP